MMASIRYSLSLGGTEGVKTCRAAINELRRRVRA